MRELQIFEDAFPRGALERVKRVTGEPIGVAIGHVEEAFARRVGTS